METITAIDDELERNSFRVFPNPAADKLTIEIPFYNSKTVGLSIVSVSGVKVLEETFEGAGMEKAVKTVDVSAFERGVYFITVDNGKKKQNRKLIVK